MVSVASRVRPLSDRWFFTGMALAMAGVTFLGFAPSYFLGIAGAGLGAAIFVTGIFVAINSSRRVHTAGAGIVGVPGVVGAVLLLNVFLAALVIYDFTTRGRLHPVTLWGVALIVLSEPLRFAIGFSAPWQAFARIVMG